jgi:hypothetical protein
MSLLMGWDLYRLDILESSYSILMQELELIVLCSFGTIYAKTHLTKESSILNVCVFRAS